MEKSANLPDSPAPWWVDGRSHRLCQLFSCYQNRRPRLDESNCFVVCDLRIGLPPWGYAHSTILQAHKSFSLTFSFVGPHDQLLAFSQNFLAPLFCLSFYLRSRTKQMVRHLQDWSLSSSLLPFSAKVFRSACRQPLR